MTQGWGYSQTSVKPFTAANQQVNQVISGGAAAPENSLYAMAKIQNAMGESSPTNGGYTINQQPTIYDSPLTPEKESGNTMRYLLYGGVALVALVFLMRMGK